uniref:Uncharacterized protein n=1 Tax=Vespula pensylvanica TaxID=30213 RepID=A0A834UFN4_VESPE|nr:hypothetical protein H0235_004023 [Vespula pensylvanica]
MPKWEPVSYPFRLKVLSPVSSATKRVGYTITRSEWSRGITAAGGSGGGGSKIHSHRRLVLLGPWIVTTGLDLSPFLACVRCERREERRVSAARMAQRARPNGSAKGDFSFGSFSPSPSPVSYDRPPVATSSRCGHPEQHNKLRLLVFGHRSIFYCNFATGS